jgi:hypothetical protein
MPKAYKEIHQYFEYSNGEPRANFYIGSKETHVLRYEITFV